MRPDEDMPLTDMLRLGLEKHINLLKDISSRASKEFALEKVSTDLPTFYEIKAEDLTPFGKKTQNVFLLGKYSDIFICQ